MSATVNIATLRQHELVILRRLRDSPLTEFEIVAEIAAASAYSADQAARHIAEWLDDLHQRGLVWLGRLLNRRGQEVLAAALTSQGRDVVN